MTTYSDSGIYNEIGESFVERKNGTIYNHHDYSNKIRLMIRAFENKDFVKTYSFYDKKAQYKNMPIDTKSMTLNQMKDSDKKMIEEFDITSINVVGYPDYLNYEMGNSKVVQFWWNMRMTRKSDKKKIVLPVLFIDSFNDQGMILDEIAYYSDSLINK